MSAVRLENQEVVLGKYSGGWKIHCDDPERSGPASLITTTKIGKLLNPKPEFWDQCTYVVRDYHSL